MNITATGLTKAAGAAAVGSGLQPLLAYAG